MSQIPFLFCACMMSLLTVRLWFTDSNVFPYKLEDLGRRYILCLRLKTPSSFPYSLNESHEKCFFAENSKTMLN
jgi:hypothetical protein